MRNRFLLLIVTIIAGAILVACGGGGGGGDSTSSGGGGNSGSSGGGSTTAPASNQVILTQATITPSTVLATTTQTTKVAFLLLDKVQRSFNQVLKTIVPHAYAVTGCGQLCSPSYPPVSASSTQQITQQLAGGSLVPLSLVFSPASTSGVIQCDFTNAGIEVKNLWLLDETTNNVLASLSVPVSVDSNCNLTYATNDYLILSSGAVYQLDKNITGTITDIIPANDPAFNTSPNTLIISNSMVSELIISTSTGQVTLNQLTTTSAPVLTYMGAIAYDGTHLIGVASSFQGWIVYEKGSTAFKLVPDTTNTGYYSTFINSQNKFVVGKAITKNVIDTTTLDQTPYVTQITTGMYGANGRYGSWIMGDRCIVLDTNSGNWVSLNQYPNNVQSSKGNNESDLLFSYTGGVGYSYSRIYGNNAYCVSGAGKLLSSYVKFNLDTQSGQGFDLNAAGYLASSYQVFSNVAYATVTNTANSNVEYIQLNFDTGVLTYLGTIITGTRQVTQLVKMGGA